MQDASGLLKEALELLQQYRAAPALQSEVQAAYEAGHSTCQHSACITCPFYPMCTPVQYPTSRALAMCQELACYGADRFAMCAAYVPGNGQW